MSENFKVASISINNIRSETISAGSLHSLGISYDGKVYSWGRNNEGQLGNGTTNNSNVPVEVDTSGVLNGKTIVQISAGTNTSFALDSDGKVYSWGRNNYGQLGDGTTTQRNSPVAVVNGSVNFTSKNIVQISVVGFHCLALDDQGKVYAWGYNYRGQLGNSSTTNRTSPVSVVDGGVNFTSKIIVQVSAGEAHSLALDEDGKVYAWGINNYGQLGDGTTTFRTSPVAVVNGNVSFTSKNLVQVSAGGSHSLALDEDGKVYAWGYNSFSSLGDGTTTNRASPVAVVDGGVNFTSKTIVEISAGEAHSLALDSEGKVYAWGINAYGQLGDGSGSENNYDDYYYYYDYYYGINSSVPVVVVDGDISFTSRNIVQISAGEAHSLAIDDNGIGYSWGGNWNGQLGDETNNNSNEPVQIYMDDIGLFYVKNLEWLGHQVDIENKWRIELSDILPYMAAYRQGESWYGEAIGRGGVALFYVLNAMAIYTNGEYYERLDDIEEPNCWVALSV
jgi:alpha-tubulin suppressor-like RCC1 family protein